MRRALSIALAILAFPSVAEGDVLIEALPSHMACGDQIRMGVWYQSFSGGPRWAKLTVKSINGKTLARRAVHATTEWRYYTYTPRCGHTYWVRYDTPGGPSSYRVRVGR